MMRFILQVLDRVLDFSDPRTGPFFFVIICSSLSLLVLTGLRLWLSAMSGSQPHTWPGIIASFWLTWGPVAFTANLLGLVFGNLQTSNLRRGMSALIFGLAVPSFLLVSLIVSLYLSKGILISGLDTRQGIVNLILMFGFFGSQGTWIYLSLTKK